MEVAGTSAEVLEIDEVDQKFESRKSKTHTKRMSSEAVVSGTPERAWQGAAQVYAAPSSHLTTRSPPSDLLSREAAMRGASLSPWRIHL